MLRKSIKLLLVQLFGILLIVETVNCYGLGNVENNHNNNDKESHSTTTLGSSVPATTTTTTSTATSILSEFLATFTFSDSQSPLTTIQQQSTLGPVEYRAKLVGPNVPTDVRHESKETTQPADIARTSIQPAQTKYPALITVTSDFTQTSDTIIKSTVDTQPEISTITATTLKTDGHVLLGCGPNNREGIGIQKALDWLREKRSPDYGWENDTHMVILAKELSNARESSDNDGHLQTISDLEDMLSVKEMEVEIMIMLDKHRTIPKPLNSDRAARYILSLGSLCKDPRRFYGHDLVATLQHHEPSQDYEFALATLAVCSSATHVRKRQIRRLLDIASGEVTNVDTMAMVLLALRCIVTDHRHRHLQHFIRRPARGLASLQGPKGSFGSLRSTALAIQALQDLELDPAGSWNRTAASQWILDRQRSDGGWTEEPLQDGQDATVGVGLTADIILALGCKGLGAVRALQCDHVMRESNGDLENGEPKLAQPVGLPSSAEDTESKNVTYTYTLWLESNITENYTLTLISSKNTSFFKAMTQAQDQDPKFAFEAREWPNGHYVHTLAGKSEEPTLYHYWLLYRLPEFPDPNNPPGNQLIAPVGVDELLVEDGEHYLYWYKKL